MCNIYTDHKSLKYIFDKKKYLNLHQRRWMESIKDYDCIIHYHPGKANVVANMFSKKGHKIQKKGPHQDNKKDNAIVVAISIGSTIIDQIKKGQPLDSQYETLKQKAI